MHCEGTVCIYVHLSHVKPLPPTSHTRGAPPPEDPQTRDAWWREVRCEIRSHMKVLNCTEVAGYEEYTSI